jgi:hypothetical protein
MCAHSHATWEKLSEAVPIWIHFSAAVAESSEWRML